MAGNFTEGIHLMKHPHSTQVSLFLSATWPHLNWRSTRKNDIERWVVDMPPNLELIVWLYPDNAAAVELMTRNSQVRGGTIFARSQKMANEDAPWREAMSETLEVIEQMARSLTPQYKPLDSSI